MRVARTDVVQSEPPRASTGSAQPYLRRYLRLAPLSVAVWRSVEAKFLSAVPLPAPVLDLGCGFGEFAQVFFSHPPDVGLDISRGDLAVARRDGSYRNVVQADARLLCLRDGQFGSVISVSTLEHIEEPLAVVREAFRVLRPGGTFAVTAPTTKLNDYLLFPRLLRRIGLRPLATAYARLVNGLLRHVTLITEEAWVALLEQAGFEVTLHRPIVSPAATALFDLGLVPALPKRAWRLVSGRRLLRPGPLVSFWEHRLIRYVDQETPDGSNVLLVARKPRR